MKTRILLVDDHTILRQGLKQLIDTQNDMDVVGEARDGNAAVERAGELAPHVVIMDISMPDLDGVEATRRIVATCNGAKVIALSMHAGRSSVSDMLHAGASAYLTKTASTGELLEAIRTVIGGEVYLGREATAVVFSDCARRPPDAGDRAYYALTGREREVLQLVAEGCTTKEMAARLHVSMKTVETHRSQIMEKLGIHRVAGLTKFAVREGITSPEP